MEASCHCRRMDLVSSEHAFKLSGSEGDILLPNAHLLSNTLCSCSEGNADLHCRNTLTMHKMCFTVSTCSLPDQE